MAIVGEQIKSLLRNAPPQADVVLCAPFIKEQVFHSLLLNIGRRAKLRVFTRWYPWEVAMGVSDLEVLELCNDRPKTQLYLVDNLHAKAYVAGEQALIGSANLTATALGWSEQPNIEILTEIPATAEELSTLLLMLERNCREATSRERRKIAEEATRLSVPASPESHVRYVLSSPWLPRCAAPEQLYAIYAGQNNESLLRSTVSDAQGDLKDLVLPIGLDQQEFHAEIKKRLLTLSTFNEIAEKARGQFNDQSGKELVQSLRTELDDKGAQMLWGIVRTWFDYFFDEFEVVTHNHVLRIKSRAGR